MIVIIHYHYYHYHTYVTIIITIVIIIVSSAVQGLPDGVLRRVGVDGRHEVVDVGGVCGREQGGGRADGLVVGEASRSVDVQWLVAEGRGGGRGRQGARSGVSCQGLGRAGERGGVQGGDGPGGKRERGHMHCAMFFFKRGIILVLHLNLF